MKAYKVLDIFSYVSEKAISLKQIEELFLNGMHGSEYGDEGYEVSIYEQGYDIDENIRMAVFDLENEGKKLHLLKRMKR